MAVVAALTLLAAAAGVWSAAWATMVNRSPFKHGALFTSMPDATGGEISVFTGKTTAWQEGQPDKSKETAWREGRPDRVAAAGVTRWRSNEENTPLRWSSPDGIAPIRASGHTRWTSEASWTGRNGSDTPFASASASTQTTAWTDRSEASTRWTSGS